MIFLNIKLSMIVSRIFYGLTFLSIFSAQLPRSCFFRSHGLCKGRTTIYQTGGLVSARSKACKFRLPEHFLFETPWSSWLLCGTFVGVLKILYRSCLRLVLPEVLACFFFCPRGAGSSHLS